MISDRDGAEQLPPIHRILLEDSVLEGRASKDVVDWG